MAAKLRKPPLDDTQMETLTGLLRDGLTIASATKFMRISLPTFEGWLRKYPSLRMAVDESVAHHEHTLLAHATRHAQRDGKIAIALLERRYGHWNKTDKREVDAKVQSTTVSPALLAALAHGKEDLRGGGAPQGPSTT